jgi:purine-binding chemotaxis protein CheW
MEHLDSDEWVASQLQARARHLAEAPPAELNQASLDVLLCQVGEEQYAIPLDDLRAILPALGMTAVPCTPPFVAGILNVRGEILTVLDLCAALQAGQVTPHQDDWHVLIVEQGPIRVGLLVRQVIGIDRLILDALDRPVVASEFARGVAAARVTLLRVEQLLSERFEVLEDVS